MRGFAFRNASKRLQSLIKPCVARHDFFPRPSLTLVASTFNVSTQWSVTRRTFSTEPDWTDDKFTGIMKENKLVVFMKGTPESPMCGFSKYVVQIMHMHGYNDFRAYNVLEDEVLRNRVKEFSNWPTIPQVYMGGEFVGGFDILLQMHQNGELVEEFDKIGHKSSLIDAENQ